MVKPKGGKGHPAPYETTHVRVPVPIKDKVQQLVDDYRRQVLEAETYFAQSSSRPLSLEDAKQEAKKILKQKKSAPESVLKLLTAIYSQQISKEDLT